MRVFIFAISLILLSFAPAKAQDAPADGQAVAVGSQSEIDALMARAKNEEAGAQEALGNRYELGKGVPQDYTEAANWYSKAANQGVVKAQVELGTLYAKGLGVQRDYEEAYFWLSISTDPLSGGSNSLLAEVESYLNSDQRANVEKRVANWKPSKKHGALLANAVERRGVESCGTRDAVQSLRLPRRATKKCKEAYSDMKAACAQNGSCHDCEVGLDTFSSSCGPQEEADPAYGCDVNSDCGLVDVDCNKPYAPVAVNRMYMSRERKQNNWPLEGCPRMPQERQSYRAVCLSHDCVAQENSE